MSNQNSFSDSFLSVRKECKWSRLLSNMFFVPLIIVTFFMIAAVNPNPCSASPSNDHIRTGYSVLVLNNKNTNPHSTQIFTYQFSSGILQEIAGRSFNSFNSSKLQIAHSLQEMSYDNGNRVYSFSVRHVKNTTGEVGFVMIQNGDTQDHAQGQASPYLSATYVSIKVGYMLVYNMNEEFMAGQFTVDTPEFIQDAIRASYSSLAPGMVKYRNKLVSKLIRSTKISNNNSNNYDIKLFIVGQDLVSPFRSAPSQQSLPYFLITLSQLSTTAFFNTSSSQITFTLRTMESPQSRLLLASVRISYLVINKHLLSRKYKVILENNYELQQYQSNLEQEEGSVTTNTTTNGFHIKGLSQFETIPRQAINMLEADMITLSTKDLEGQYLSLLKINRVHCQGDCIEECISLQDCQALTKNNEEKFTNSTTICIYCQSFNTVLNPQTLICQSINSKQCTPFTEFFNFQTNKCECVPGLLLIIRNENISSCGQCPTGTVYNATSLECVQRCQKQLNLTFQPETGLCRCIDGMQRGLSGECQLLNEGNGSKTPTTLCSKSNTTLNLITNKCQCSSGYFNISNICQQCPSGTIYNNFSRTCTKLCIGINEQFINGQCVCAQGFVKIGSGSGFCGHCQIGTVYNSENKVCERTGENGKNQTQILPECRRGQSIVNWTMFSTQCRCTQGGPNIYGECLYCFGKDYNAQSFSCQSTAPVPTPVPTCPSPNQYYSTVFEQCLCIEGYVLIEDTCGQCPLNSTYDYALKNCIQPTPNRCTKANQILFSNICICDAGYSRIGQQCSQCAIGEQYNVFTRQCDSKCENGQVFNEQTSQCQLPQPQCTQGQSYNSQTNQCYSICLSVEKYGWFYSQDTGQCEFICQVSEYFDNELGQCVGMCPDGYQFNQKTIQCEEQQAQPLQPQECAPGQIHNPLIGQCEDICKGGQIWTSDGFCVCQQGLNYLANLQQCGQCDSGQVYDSATQTCSQPQPNTCPDPNSYYSASTQQCECYPSYVIILHKSTNLLECQQCPVNTTYSSSSLECISNPPNPTPTPTPTPTSCNYTSQTYNSLTNTCQCNQANGYFFIYDRCGTCPFFTAYNSQTLSCELDLNQVIIQTNGVYSNGGQAVVSEDGGAMFSLNQNIGIASIIPPVITQFQYQLQVLKAQCQQRGMLWINNQRCKCPRNFILVKQNETTVEAKCTQCPENTIDNANQTECIAEENSQQSFLTSPTDTTTSNTNQAVSSAQTRFSLQALCRTQPHKTWAANKCICEQGYHLSSYDDQCYQCIGLGIQFNGKRCECQRGYYELEGAQKQEESQEENKNQTIISMNQFSALCSVCHIKCATCTGPQQTQCLTCANIQHMLKVDQSNGQKLCTQKSICPKGYFLEKTEQQTNNLTVSSSASACSKCSSYCIQCTLQSNCKQCIDGFKLSVLVLAKNIEITTCEEICGDGKRFELQCDDGNTVDGDGCNSMCEQQSEWTCMGGTTNKKDVCLYQYRKTSGLPQPQQDRGVSLNGLNRDSPISDPMVITQGKSVIQMGQTVVQNNRIYQNFRMSTLPVAITQNNCALCTQIFNIYMVSTQIHPDFIKLTYIQTSKYQFVIEFRFDDIWAIPPFMFEVKIKEQYAKYFSQWDMQQRVSMSVEPMMLSRPDQTSLGVLTLDEIMLQNEGAAV